LKTPKFWAQRGAAAVMLAPLGLITRGLTARRVKKPGFDPGIPVICAGNAGVGGAGKTILVLDLLARLPGRPFALTRGYKGSLHGPVQVRPGADPRAAGDEALLLAQAAPTILARDRAAGARLALAEGATAIVMDDGLQNPALKKKRSLLVIDGGYGFGNGLLLPAGPLREPVAAAAARCQAAVLIGDDRTQALACLPPGLPVLRAELVASCAVSLAGAKVVAFAGIGRPEKFFETVAGLEARIAARIPFADHHAYTAADLHRLSVMAARLEARLVTTAKDFVKLPPALKSQVTVVSVHLAWRDEAMLQNFLSGIV
jgi:tetraacyldisaccharide 4'-kinase